MLSSRTLSVSSEATHQLKPANLSHTSRQKCSQKNNSKKKGYVAQVIKQLPQSVTRVSCKKKSFAKFQKAQFHPCCSGTRTDTEMLCCRLISLSCIANMVEVHYWCSEWRGGSMTAFGSDQENGLELWRRRSRHPDSSCSRRAVGFHSNMLTAHACFREPCLTCLSQSPELENSFLVDLWFTFQLKLHFLSFHTFQLGLCISYMVCTCFNLNVNYIL